MHGYGGHMWSGFDGMSWGWIGLGLVHMGLFWIVVILGIMVLARWLGAGSGSERDPVAILKERYSRGEVTRDQFEQMKRDLNS